MTLPPWPLDWRPDPRKMVDHLFNEGHVEGGPKAQFFLRFGFAATAPNRLAYEILSHAQPETYVGQAMSRFGAIKYVFEGPIRAPEGRTPRSRTVWRIDPNLTVVPLTR